MDRGGRSNSERQDPLPAAFLEVYTKHGPKPYAEGEVVPVYNKGIFRNPQDGPMRSGDLVILYFEDESMAVWKSTSASGANAIEQASRRWRGGRRCDSARTRRKILISTQVPTAELGFAPLQTSALQTSVFQQSRVPSQRRQTVVQDQLPVQTAGLEVSGAHAASPVAVALPQAV